METTYYAIQDTVLATIMTNISTEVNEGAILYTFNIIDVSGTLTYTAVFLKTVSV